MGWPNYLCTTNPEKLMVVHKAMLALRLGYLYTRADLLRHIDDIMKYWNMDDTSHRVPVHWPFYGKTAFEMHLAAIDLYFRPGSWTRRWVVSNYQSKAAIRDQLIPTFRRLPGADAMIRTVNDSKVEVQSFGSEPGMLSTYECVLSRPPRWFAYRVLDDGSIDESCEVVEIQLY
jgi:hypothetical protein